MLIQPDPEEDMKECSDCRSILPYSFFKKNSRKIDGHNRYCIVCESTRRELYKAVTSSNDPRAILE